MEEEYEEVLSLGGSQVQQGVTSAVSEYEEPLTLSGPVDSDVELPLLRSSAGSIEVAPSKDSKFVDLKRCLWLSWR